MQRVNEEFAAQYNMSFSSVENTRVAAPDPKIIAYVRNGSILGVNARQLNNDRMFAQDAQRGWSAPGGASPQGVLVHEMGHYLTENHPEYSTRSGHGQNVWSDASQAARNAPDWPAGGTGVAQAMGNHSRYAQTDRHEAEAELFAFYHMGGSQRPQWVVAWGEAWHRGHGLDPTPIGERL
jgi:hypothetical protein